MKKMIMLSLFLLGCGHHVVLESKNDPLYTMAMGPDREGEKKIEKTIISSSFAAPLGEGKISLERLMRDKVQGSLYSLEIESQQTWSDVLWSLLPFYEQRTFRISGRQVPSRSPQAPQ